MKMKMDIQNFQVPAGQATYSKSKKPNHKGLGFLLDSVGVADGARTHDNRNHNPYFFYLHPLIIVATLYINQQLKIQVLDEKTA
jgi:hypothetical protein